jgi:hypothetical protein
VSVGVAEGCRQAGGGGGEVWLCALGSWWAQVVEVLGTAGSGKKWVGLPLGGRKGCGGKG